MFVIALLCSCLVPANSRKVAAVVDPRYGGTLTVADFNRYPGFCIGSNPDSSAVGMFRAIYDTLVERNADDGFTPFLADSVTPSNGNLTWTIRLRSGVKFHDGTTLDASVLKLNLDSLRGVASTNVPLSRVVGIINIGLTNIMSVTAVDSLTVEVGLELPQIDFVETLYMGGRGFIRAEAQLTSSACSTTPIGTGPFKKTSFSADGVSLVRNDDYWRIDPVSGNQLPYLNQLNFVAVTDPAGLKNAVTGTDSSAPWADISMFTSINHAQEITELRNMTTTLREYTSRNDAVLTIYLNAGKNGSPLRSRNARLALAHATNHQRFRDVKFLGLGDIPQSLIPRRSEMFTSEGFPAYNLELARQYVSAYKAETGATSLAITIPSSLNARDIETWSLLSTMWAEAGITLNVAVEEQAVIIAKAVNASRTGAEQNAYDLVPLTMSFGSETGYNSQFYRADAYNPNTTNPEFPSSSSLRQKLSTILNFSHQPETTMDEKLLLAHSQSTLKLSAEKFREAMAHYQNQAYAIPVVNGFLSVFTSPRIGGIGTSYLAPGVPEKYMTSGGPNWAVLFKSMTDQPLRNTGVSVGLRNEIWTGAHPQGVVNISAGVAYVARTDEGEICQVSLTTGVLSSCVSVGGAPVGLIRDRQALNGYFIDSASRKLRKFVFSTGAFSDIVTLPSRPNAVAVNSVSSHAFVSSSVGNAVYRIRLSDGQLVDSVSVSGGPTGVAIENGGQALWVAQSIADKVIRVALGSSSVAHSVAALIAQSREQSVISSSINSINVGSRPAGLKMSADGRFLFVVNENDDTMTKIDIGSSGETWTFRISNQPRELSLDETANRIYISGIFSNSIAVVQIPETVVPAPVANLPIPVEVSPPAVGTPSPSVQSPTSGSSQTTVVISPQVKIGRTISSKSLVGVAKIPLKAGSTIRLRVMQSSAKFCKVTGSSLRGMKAGTCKVAVTVTPKKGRTTSKTVTVRVLK
jgi:peptide/nickel transport system substrate-binding protein